MDEAEEILLSSLRSSGVSLPSGLSASSSSIKGLSPGALVSVCAQSLRLIRGAGSASLPTSIPDAAAERFKVCADVAAVFKSIGYKDDLSFHQLRNETEYLKDQETSLKEKTQSKVFEIQGLEAEYELLKAAVKMAFDDQHSIELCLKELNEQAEARRGNLVKLEMQW
ncbi:hypothetical protein BHE74_00033986 [Ensete ventricosum]|uniref:CCDC22 N-terminal domain-containing protein n=1 Tax=Ensete ventricosum TaxID=4639 RepID=A0A427AV30_ENSVE|nr:hypothetical protein B296_00022588 [Ensete ventricosum]RWW59084.1 hypothetical protein BHE74_00033986 [Ensete ventricosum]